MEVRPRYTALWEHQTKFIGEVLATALDDPEIDACWDYITVKLHAALKQPPHVLPTETEIRIMAAPLIKLLQERVPTLEHAWESNLGPWIIELMARMIQTAAPEIDITIPETNMKRLLPDNPVTISSDPSTGKVILRDVETATGRHFMQIQSYFQSLTAPGKPGRPKGSPKPSKSGRRSISPEAALRAYDMDSRRAHWSEIAKALWPAITPADLRKEKTRLKVRYYIERGDRLARNKSVE